MTLHRKIVVGTVMIAVLPLAYGANAIATNLYPQQRGGPNFLAGFIDLIAIGIAIGGLAVLVTVFSDRRRHRPPDLPPRPAPPVDRSRD